MHQLSRREARRIAVRAQLLDDDRPVDLHDLVRRLTMLQVDATKAVAPSADLVAWSRLGMAYEPHDLADALRERTLIELRTTIRPAEDMALYRADMAVWPGAAPGWRQPKADWVAVNDAFRREILAKLDAEGPRTSREIPDTCAVSWRSSGWNNNRNAVMMLEAMEQRGEVATTGERRGRDKLWDLASRIHPDDPVVPAADAERTRNARRLRSLGLARAVGPECAGQTVEAQDVAEIGESAVVDGVRGRWRVDPDQLDRPFHGRAALLSPLDRLVFDRKRMTEIFAFDYQLEMYKPAAARRWGYYALPILYGDQLVGKLDAAADRKAGVLQVHAIHQDGDWTRAMSADIDHEIDGLAEWLDLSRG